MSSLRTPASHGVFINDKPPPHRHSHSRTIPWGSHLTKPNPRTAEPTDCHYPGGGGGYAA